MTSLVEGKIRNAERKFLLDPYLDWAEAQQLPIHDDFCVDMLSAEVAYWEHSGTDAALVHVGGRGDFASTFLYEIAPGRETVEQQHLFEGVVYVLSGHGQTVFRTAAGRDISFEWGPRSMFAIPPNTRHQFYNLSGSEPARIAVSTDAPIIFNIFRDEKFIFHNGFDFSERLTADINVSGDGELIENIPGRHMWVTNYVADLASFELKDWKERGAGGKNLSFVLADGTIHAHVSEMPVGTYKKAHRHDAGIQIFPVTGKGYSLLWYEGDDEMRRVDWKHGSVYAPGHKMFHQHFNTSPQPSRYMATMFGSMRYPITAYKSKIILGADVDVKDGGMQIEYANQDPEVDRLYRAGCAKESIEYLMAPFIG